MPAAPHTIPQFTTANRTGMLEVFQEALISPQCCSTLEQKAANTSASSHFQYEALTTFADNTKYQWQIANRKFCNS